MSAWWKPSRPGELRPIPWLSPRAVVYLESILQPGFEVIEHGAGGSTLWFAERVKRVMTFETNSEWWEVVSGRAPRNAHVIYDGWGISDNWREFAPFDLLLIDGEPVTDRAAWLRLAPDVVRPGGWVVLDNANRPECAKEREKLKDCADLVCTFDSNHEAGYLYLVTEFWRMKQVEET